MDRLLEINPKRRLGRYGPYALKNHPYFKNFDWEKLEN